MQDGYVGFKNIVYKQKMSAKEFHNGYIKNKNELVFESVANQLYNNIYLPKVVWEFWNKKIIDNLHILEF